MNEVITPEDYKFIMSDEEDWYGVELLTRKWKEGEENGIAIEKADARFDHLLTLLGKVKMNACVTA